MIVTIRVRNIQLTDSLKDYVEKRLSKLEKYLDNIDEAQVTLTVESNAHHRVEVTIPLAGGMILRGEEETADMYSSVDLVIEKLSRQIEKYKGRIFDKKGRGPGRKFFASSAYEEDEPLLVKTKRFAMKPMDAEEAIMQMNLLGHSFYVFMNCETNQVNVVYRRKDGKYGLIEPDFD